VRERRAGEPRFLMFEPDDLRDPDTIPHDAAAFPAELPLENRALPLNYAYKPGQADDGVTLDVSVREAEALTVAALDWAVPGHLEAKVEHYLRALPKELRRAFVPLAETAKSLAAELQRGGPGAPRAAGKVGGHVPVPAFVRPIGAPPALPAALAAQIAADFRVAIDPAVWVDKPLPDHLRVRIRVIDAGGRELCASRDLAEIHAGLAAQSREASAAVAREDPPAWRAARVTWETTEHTAWAFGEIPDRVLVTEQAGAPVYAFPGLRAGTDGVSRRLFKTPEEARAATQRGIAALLERQLGRELGWLQRDLRAMRELGALTATIAPLEDLQEQAFASIRLWACDPERMGGSARPGTGLGAAKSAGAETGAPTAAGFAAALEKSQADLRGLVPRFVDLLREILTLRQELMVQKDPFPNLARDLAVLLPADFLRRTPYAQLGHFPRYLQAMKLRAERWRKNPAKDAERVAQLAPYLKTVAATEVLRWLVEEFRVSLFAQELGTAEPVSAVKLDRAIAARPAGGTGGARREDTPAVPPKPIVTVPVTGKKAVPIKNLGALDKLFPR
jgi:ATP-dependent helicase HrpA